MKRTYVTSLLIAICFSACNNNTKVVESNIVKEIANADTLTGQPKSILTDSLIIPSKQFLRLAKQIDSAGFIWDTARIKKVVHYFRTDSVVIIDVETYLFYKMKLDDSWLIEFYNHNKNKTVDFYEGSLINYDYFKKAKSITGYYYTQKEKTNFKTDGYIEEWIFPTTDDAEKAVQDVARVKEKVYFNTESYCCRIDDKLYIFHTRAMGFSFQLKKFFKQFVTDNNAVIPKSV
jgi:hypothetical protein